MSACSELVDRFEAMESNGLVDVKFYFRNTDDYTSEMLCSEVLTLLNAHDAGEYVELPVSDLVTR